jgi:Domain of unknown function (DUF4395)
MSELMEKVDKTALKFNQSSIVVFTGLAFLIDNYWLVLIVGIILLLDTIIPVTGLFKLIYKNIVKPLKLLKSNISVESKNPHQFAQGMGGILLIISFILLNFFNLLIIGWTISLIVIAFAFINVTLNFCAGCFIYFQIQKIKLSSVSSLTENKNV